MRKRFFYTLFSLVLAFYAISTKAITISFDPTAQTASGSASVGLRISDLVAGGAPSLGVFDLNVSFDPSIIAFSGATFGDPVLGDQLDLLGFGSLTSSGSVGPGVINVFELSLDPAATLDLLQEASFI